MAAPEIRRWGLLGLGNIARKFARDLQAHGLCVHAVASRDAAKAAAFAREIALEGGVAGGRDEPRAYGGYAALLADPTIDCVYIALPNSLHSEYTLKAARAGKAVLCEKPFSADPREAEAVLREVERCGTLFMEGFMYRCHPQYALIRERLDRGDIGEVRLIEARFGYQMGKQTENIRLRPDLLGGALLDVGCYGVSLARWVTREEPVHVAGFAANLPSGVDGWFSGTLAFPGGALAAVQCASHVQQPSWAAIYGEKGRIEIPEPWKPAPQGAMVRVICGEVVETLTCGDGLALFAREALAVEAALRAGAREVAAMPWSDSLGQAAALAALRARLAAPGR